MFLLQETLCALSIGTIRLYHIGYNLPLHSFYPLLKHTQYNNQYSQEALSCSWAQWDWNEIFLLLCCCGWNLMMELIIILHCYMHVCCILPKLTWIGFYSALFHFHHQRQHPLFFLLNFTVGDHKHEQRRH